jgi:hypothetical protein
VKTLITVTRNGDAIRISRVTAHGEEVIEADAEARALAVLLWGRIMQHEMSQNGQPLLPWNNITTSLSRLNSAVERLTERLDANTHAMNVAQTQQVAPKPTPVRRGQ